jgi:D-serine deaminase-like pyridoxal phosphate-dependent protein
MNPHPAEIGDPIADFDTPALIVDLDALIRNIVKMTEFAHSTGSRARPHARTHKSAAMALRQIANGAVGQWARKVGEPDALVRGGANASRARRPRLMRQFERAVVDAHLKSCSGERGPSWVQGPKDVELTPISDERGKLTRGPKAKRLSVGEKVWLIPGHCDATVNLLVCRREEQWRLVTLAGDGARRRR